MEWVFKVSEPITILGEVVQNTEYIQMQILNMGELKTGWESLLLPLNLQIVIVRDEENNPVE